MQCKSAPFIDTIGRRVRCGRCLACRIKFRNDWASRIHMEVMSHHHYHGLMPFFVTLTYKPEALPEGRNGNPTLHKKSFRQWLKDAQKAHGAFRYYACGEYGEVAQRPHYHMVLFPFYRGQEVAVADHWKRNRGHTDVLPFRYGACNYVTKYATKFSVFRKEIEEDQEPEFRLSSTRPPLGQTFAFDLLEQLDSRGKDFWLNTVGDVPKCYQVAGRKWPVTAPLIRKMRARYGIPSTEIERIVRCPTHVDYVDYEEPILCTEAHLNQTEQIRAKEKQKTHRTRGAKF